MEASRTLRRTRLAITIALVFPIPVFAQQNPAAQLEAPTVEVIGTTPLPGLGTPRDQVPSNVQAATEETIERQQPLAVSDFLNQNFSSVYINEAQSNPFQPDVTFRGFTASPLLGSPIGLSVYVDGVRVNEAFGDTVNWDLIPASAISTINLIPGSNPVFGLNTLGGALAVRTKSGFHDPGTTAQFYAGSFGRRATEISHGGFKDNVDWFFTGNLFEEDGWRDRSPTRVKQFFGKLGWENERSDIDFSYTYAGNDLIGNGIVPESLLNQDREAVYTFPDETRPELDFFNLKGSHLFTDKLLFSSIVYYRKVRIGTFNGDAEFDDGDTPLDPTDDETEAENRMTTTRSNTLGTSVQLQSDYPIAGFSNQASLGVTFDRGRTIFSQAEQEADFTPDRGTTPDGDFELDTLVKGENDYYGLYLTDTFGVTDRLHVTASGRYNYAKIRINDLSGMAPELEGNHSFNRFNPAVGATFAVAPAATIYGSYNEGFRVPTPIELTCADPDDPCALPVSFVADPPLDPVVARTYEGGVRGNFLSSMRYNASVYRTRLSDDILFVGIGGSQGFFTNVPKTRRQGIELGLGGDNAGVIWSVNYSYVEATFEAPTSLFNPVANVLDPTQPATIDVSPGDRLPGIPRHLAKLNADWRANDAITVGGSVIYAGSQFLRGDENNQRGQLSGYAVVNLRAEYRFTRFVSIFALVNNLFNKDYETLGAFNRNAFDENSEPLEGVGVGPVERFLSPGAPRAGWVGIRLTFGAPNKSGN